SDSLPAVLLQPLQAQAAAGTAPAQQRALVMLRALAGMAAAGGLRLFTLPGGMGATTALQAGLGDITEVLPVPVGSPSSAGDTQAGALALREAGVDILLFAGGDGTARDVCAAIGQSVPVLGVPAGVKMHSGVFAINPLAAASLLGELLAGRWVTLDLAEVRDIDEDGVRAGRVRARHFGEMRVPVEARYLQQVKCSGREVEALVLAEIAAGLVEAMVPGRTYALGPGTTVAAVMESLALDNTLLGFDLVRDGELVRADVDAAGLLAAAEADPGLTVVITPTGGQGSLIGRGNQQLTPALLRRLGREQVMILATHAKLEALDGRPLRLDTGDGALDAGWSGLWPVTTGYQQQVLYAVQG
ncbi:MAG: NAD(+)/NADH kinase, partial [Perlucidibaca sp.]